MPVTTRYLLEGACYALEQCGLVLGDAALLYQRGRFGTATCLALLAREELGKARLLLILRDAADAGEAITIDSMKTVFEDHVRKQKAAQLSVMTAFLPGSEGSRLLQQCGDKDLASPEWKAFLDYCNDVARYVAKAWPGRRADMRETGVYVDPSSAGQSWQRPVEFPRETAEGEIISANNDYSSFKRMLEHGDEYASAREELKGWPEQPKLPSPSWPREPDPGDP